MRKYTNENKIDNKRNYKVIKPNMYIEVSEALKNQSPKNISQLILETLKFKEKEVNSPVSNKSSPKKYWN